MTTSVLLLNADYKPIKVIPWEKAVYLLLDEKARLVVEYTGKVIRSAHTEMAWPAVIALVRYAKSPNKVRFSRSNLLARDAYRCNYCGVRPRTANKTPKLEDLTIDHVVPRAQSRNGHVVLPWNGNTVAVTCWENTTTACLTCNAAKADKTPAQAKMTLRVTPRKPSSWDTVLMTLRRTSVPAEWRDYVPQDSQWRDYWDVELDPD